MARGRFIALEGGEGCGKSTQARLLANALAERGMPVVLSREPGGTPGAEAIRSLLLHPPGEGWEAPSEALLFAAARADHVARLIRPSLDRGSWVVCDRFLDSSRAYQGGAGGIGDAAVLALHDIGSGGLRPDLTLLISIDAEIATRRLAARDGDAADAIGSRGGDYHRAVGEAFARLAENDAKGVVTIDGSGTEEEVHGRILEVLGPWLEGA
jgi:dTMP kinase